MIVIETTLQIDEVNEHAALSGDAKSRVNTLMPTALINEGYMKLKPLLYPCTIEFSLMSLTFFYLIWENIGKTFRHSVSDKASTKNVFLVNCHASTKGLFGGMIVFASTLISIILYVVLRHKPVEHTISHGHETNSSHEMVHGVTDTSAHGVVILDIANLCLLALSLFATLWSLIKIRKLNYRRSMTRK